MCDATAYLQQAETRRCVSRRVVGKSRAKPRRTRPLEVVGNCGASSAASLKQHCPETSSRYCFDGLCPSDLARDRPRKRPSELQRAAASPVGWAWLGLGATPPVRRRRGSSVAAPRPARLPRHRDIAPQPGLRPGSQNTRRPCAGRGWAARPRHGVGGRHPTQPPSPADRWCRGALLPLALVPDPGLQRPARGRVVLHSCHRVWRCTACFSNDVVRGADPRIDTGQDLPRKQRRPDRPARP